MRLFKIARQRELPGGSDGVHSVSLSLAALFGLSLRNLKHRKVTLSLAMAFTGIRSLPSTSKERNRNFRQTSELGRYTSRSTNMTIAIRASFIWNFRASPESKIRHSVSFSKTGARICAHCTNMKMSVNGEENI